MEITLKSGLINVHRKADHQWAKMIQPENKLRICFENSAGNEKIFIDLDLADAQRLNKNLENHLKVK